MKKLFLILPLTALLFATQGWAPPPGKGGATGGQDLSKCDLKPKEQTKVTLKDKSGKVHHICTGLAVCGGKSVTVSCKVSEKEECPIAKKCVTMSGVESAIDGIEDHEYDSMTTEELKKYWTPERIEKAIPEEMEVDPKDLRGLSQSEEPLGRSLIISNPRNIPDQLTDSAGKLTEGPAIKVKELTPLYRPTGVLLYNKKGITGDFRCTASLIYLEKTKEIGMLSAAHCFYDQKTRKPSRWHTFVPEYGFIDKRKHEYYGVKRHMVFGPWKRVGRVRWDIDFVIATFSKKVPEKFCCHGIIKGLSRPPKFTLGYPAVGRFAGNRNMLLINLYNLHTGERPFIRSENEFTGGSSGGPWIGGDPQSKKYGYIFGINSWIRGKTNPNKQMYSPPFGKNIENMYKCFLKERGIPGCPY
ncbi:MAG: hypothetical protein DRQ88_00080 [Epsilonproteobacteria bacterium]|nr:MAG: hypothetical protein DRQ89_10675 [Campylobacterota bacterium]RLA68034.1 MAG: hypothetical protein DRQ88_00080 [Campylobacterota bacterium]